VTDISVVIPTYNRRVLLQKTLPALHGLETQGFDYEVLLLNDGSTDGSDRCIEEFIRDNPGRLRHLSLPHSGSPAHPRNVGMREARGRIILLLDDDVIPDPDLLIPHWNFHTRHPEPEAAALGELYLPPDVESDPLSLFHSFPYDEVRRSKKLGYLFFWTCNLSFKRDFMLAHGMFDEDPALHPVEDMECGYRLCARGLEIEFVPESQGQHVHAMDMAGVPRKGERTGRAQFALSLKVPDPGMLERFGILSPELSPWLYARRVVRRAAFRAVDNPLTLGLLRLLGAERSKRNRITDAYLYLIFRRNMIAGFEAAKREHEASIVAVAARKEI
jgi:GT2 family glycosyltransferase